MNKSNNDGKAIWNKAPGGQTSSADSDEWQPTRAASNSREDADEWQSTRQPPGQALDEWQATRVLQPPSAPAPVAAPAAPQWQPVPAFSAPASPRDGGDWRGPAASPDAWASTRAQTALATQFLKDENDYLGGEKDEIGRQISSTEHELFVSCGPAEALEQQFNHLKPEFIVVHDVATTSSRKLLAGIAAASGREVQHLVIRRQGYGTALATIEFVELTTADNQSLRLYTTETEAEPADRQALAKALLGFSRLGVVMVGELPGHAIAAALKPLHDDILAGPWPNRNLLLLPLASASTLVTHGLDLGRGTGVAVRTTPQVARPADAWSFITGTWSRMREQMTAGGRAVPELGAFRAPAYQPRRAPLSTGMPSGDTLPMEEPLAPALLTMRPMPTISLGTGTEVSVPTSLIDRYVKQISELAGVVSCCAFNIQTGEPIAHAGASPGAVELAKQGTLLITAMATASRALGFGHALPEAALSLGSHHMLLRGVPKNAGLAIHAVLDKTSANLTLARLQLMRLDAMFDEPQAA